MGALAMVPVFGLVAMSFTVAVAALWVAARPAAGLARPTGVLALDDDDSIVFLFEGHTLINATEAARGLIESASEFDTDWDRFHSQIRQQFPGLRDRMAQAPALGRFVLHSVDGSRCLTARCRNDIIRITLEAADGSDLQSQPDPSHIAAMQQEIDTLRATAETAPFLVWRQNEAGKITWANNSYLALAQADLGRDDAATWPPARLFDLTNGAQSDAPNASRRLTTHIAGEAEPRWFECFETPLGDESLFTAVAADKVVKAEVALRDFVQTLTKTFAHLTIGLAIFDKQRRLALFNPALIDLTSLPASFLSSRPTLQAVLDRLREKKMIPEPTDYKSWRRRLHDLEAEAENGSYEETWSLTTGQTYRVTGRPYPDGAVAFLFEDISAEIASTRQFRAELEVSQAALDAVPEAIAVFSHTGALLLSNAAYSQLWGIDTTSVLGDFGILDATRQWADLCAPSPAWGDARDFVGSFGERAEWTANVQLRNGRALTCRFLPVSGGATLAGFSLSADRVENPATPLTPVQQLNAEIAAL